VDLRGAFLRHWPLKLTALALSVLLWVAVASQEVTSQLVAVRVELDYDDSLELARPLPSVTALVTGPGHEIIKLYNAPLVLRAAIPESATRRAFRLRLTPERLQVPASAMVTVEEVEPRDLYVRLAKGPQRS
jgi:hypothetical protein